MKRFFACLALLAGTAAADAPPTDDAAARFGARDEVIDISLSPDGKHIAMVMPGHGPGTMLYVANADGSGGRPISQADGKPFHLTSCNWPSSTRIACAEYGVARIGDTLAPFTSIAALDSDGTHPTALFRRQLDTDRVSQFSGEVIDWLSGDDGAVLMTRDYVPDAQSLMGVGGQPADQRNGLGVERVDTITGRGSPVEAPIVNASDYLSDGRGAVRLMGLRETRADGAELTGVTIWRYRLAGERGWKAFGRSGPEGAGLRPIAVDGAANVAYALQHKDGRDALYRVKLDGSLATELVYANPVVDVDDVVRIGRHGRVIGAAYVTDRRQVEYVDPAYKQLAAALGRALPGLPLIDFLSASADEQRLLVLARSDVDPGHYYVFDRTTHHLDEVRRARPALDGVALGRETAVSYPAGDGQSVPAYLTLPPGGATRHLPTIVLPHGGPASRDEWGFDWLAQYFAHLGYAVLQPEFRGSSGYGDGWYVQNGFKSWRIAIGDINDGARWLVQQGIADPDKLAILGWSYGGYAALQANVVDPDLYKAVVAIAPVTSLPMLKTEAQAFTNSRLVERFVGDGPHLVEGSPLRHPDRFRAPVLMFAGDQDINVSIAEPRAMDKALREAGKKSRLVVYPGLDHPLDDSAARTDMLGQADAFLKAALKTG